MLHIGHRPTQTARCQPVAVICVLLQLTTAPRALPSQTVPVPSSDPNSEPEIVTGVPAAAVDSETVDTLGAAGTVANVVAEILPSAAVIVASPFATPVITLCVRTKTAEGLEQLRRQYWTTALFRLSACWVPLPESETLHSSPAFSTLLAPMEAYHRSCP